MRFRHNTKMKKHQTRRHFIDRPWLANVIQQSSTKHTHRLTWFVCQFHSIDKDDLPNLHTTPKLNCNGDPHRKLNWVQQTSQVYHERAARNAHWTYRRESISAMLAFIHRIKSLYYILRWLVPRWLLQADVCVMTVLTIETRAISHVSRHGSHGKSALNCLSAQSIDFICSKSVSNTRGLTQALAYGLIPSMQAGYQTSNPHIKYSNSLFDALYTKLSVLHRYKTSPTSNPVSSSGNSS